MIVTCVVVDVRLTFTERLSRSPDTALWTPFQETASAVGNLYRGESILSLAATATEGWPSGTFLKSRHRTREDGGKAQ